MNNQRAAGQNDLRYTKAAGGDFLCPKKVARTTPAKIGLNFIMETVLYLFIYILLI